MTVLVSILIWPQGQMLQPMRIGAVFPNLFQSSSGTKARCYRPRCQGRSHVVAQIKCANLHINDPRILLYNLCNPLHARRGALRGLPALYITTSPPRNILALKFYSSLCICMLESMQMFMRISFSFLFLLFMGLSH